MNDALLVARLVFGLGMAAHGLQKLFGWFGGFGLAGTGGFLETLGFRPGRLFALAVALCESGGGLLTALGFLDPLGPALMVLVMVVAMLTVHRRNGFFVSSNGIEVPLLYAAGALMLAAVGPGIYSLDFTLGLQAWDTPAHAWGTVLLAALLGVLVTLLRGKPAAPAAPAS
jgi:putative oxidoreductase